MASEPRITIDARVPFWRSQKNLEILFQILFVIGLALLVWFMVNNMTNRLTATGRTLRINFLQTSAGFAIGEGLAFDPQQSYGRAFVVGLINTLRVTLIGIVLASILGLLAGLARLSSNWLVSNLAGLYIELIRNTPLLLQLFFWYFGVVLALPGVDEALIVPGLAVLSNRGIVLAELNLTATGLPWGWWFIPALLIAIVLGWWRTRHLRRAGRVESGAGWAIIAFVFVLVLGYLITSFTATLPDNVAYTLERGDRGLLYNDRNANGDYDEEVDTPLAFVPLTLLDEEGETIASTRTDGTGAYRVYDLPDNAVATTVQWKTPGIIAVDRPVRIGFNFVGGATMTPEFFGLLLGLVIYTGAFIAEIVRAGINAVSKGQWEASRALGLRPTTILRLIILPQALRVIVPPLTSQYLNLTKNSSLAVAIGYPDLFNVSLTILNQTGAEVQVFVLIMLTYLSFSLITSAFMNWYNQHIAVAER